MRRDILPPLTADMDELANATQLLADASSVLLLAHVNPDADALGSALALGLGLTRLGTRAEVCFAEPDSVPQSLSGLPGQHLVVMPSALADPVDLVVTLDVGTVERLGALAGRLHTANTLVLDHHASNTRFGVHHLVDPAAEATVVLVAKLLDRLAVPLDADIAANLYAGLATDTVAFRHATADTHRLAARLIDAGVQPDELMRPITDAHPFGWLPMLSAVLQRTKREASVALGADLVHTCVTMQDAAGLRSEEVDSVIDIVRTTAGRGVTAVAKQTAPQAWQVSLRSGGAVDVSRVAAALGGGGHIWAAGFTHRGDYPGAVRALTAELQRPIEVGPGL